ncbi:tRNA (5-methylaminomethyl-2-thiouridine)(34)-methyltransferase MnmD [Hymenobacter oligotrophus]|nr:tRNA (5-methylaminomethyl-2-thiouridine)(34)-methyltransferase MnmD [Hymenobacter oligotrophus]
MMSDVTKVEVRQTGDGSSTLYVPALDEHYHSTHGALQESVHVFIRAGLEPVLLTADRLQHILEVGLGTGLNALLTLQRSLTARVRIHYDAVETFPLPPDIVEALGIERYVLNPELLDLHRQLHAAPWNTPIDLTPHFELRKLHVALQQAHLPANHYQLVYFDAFAPEKQPDMWTQAVFEQLFAATMRGGILVSYCAKGAFKRSLKAAGWQVEALPGPPGKREMTRARKP